MCVVALGKEEDYEAAGAKALWPRACSQRKMAGKQEGQGTRLGHRGTSALG